MGDREIREKRVKKGCGGWEKDLDVDRETENLSMARLGEKPVTLRDGGK